MKESRGITPLRTILQNCLNHIENLETNRSISDNYDKEFQDLKQFSETLKAQKEFACTEGEKEVNRKKNRYKDILPFNVSRVILSEYAGIPGSDYINANYIKGASGSPAYIACQGPLPNTVNDFWRMVVECEVQVIVMACNAQESGKHKCENYWVEKEGEEKRFGMVQICLVKASTVCPDFLVRTMRLKYTNDKDITEERTVCQFHYSAWPDHGVPPLVRPLLDMVRLVRDTQASETLPVLVHCSAGCGRTGTICAIDFVWGLLRAGKLTEEFSLFNLVRDMRKQRVAMVQTKEQYILVHQAVRELFKEQLRVIESHPYENIDFNGVPLIKDFEEPFYDTICVQKEENCDEKQDKSEIKEKVEEVESKLPKADTAPPLPRKKRPNVLFSKQEKEAENLTEKNRSSFAEKERTDASLSSLLGKPRIVKLRQLFEKSPTTKERSALKDRRSQTVSRSHSLGAIRKPLMTEVFDEQIDRNKPSSALVQPQIDPVKLKHSKSFSKSVPLIKRSKSLKTFSQNSQLYVSPTTAVDDKIVRSSKTYESEIGSWKAFPVCDPAPAPAPAPVLAPKIPKECTKRRRSLESLMGDVPPSITWPMTVVKTLDKSNGNPKARERSLDWSPKQISSTIQGSKTADMLKYQLQRLSLETEKKMSALVSGIGIRERRNSFRQAVNKSDFQNVFRDYREQHGSTGKKLLGNETHWDGSKNIKNSDEILQFMDQPDGVMYSDREVPVDVNLTKAKTVFDLKKYKMQEKPSIENLKKSIDRHPSLLNSVVSSIHPTSLDHRRPKGILTSKSSRTYEDIERNSDPKNLFLKKLSSELLSDKERDCGSNESRSRSSNEDSDRSSVSRFTSSSVSVHPDSKKILFKTNLSVKPSGSYSFKSDNFELNATNSKFDRLAEVENSEKTLQSSSWQNFQGPQKLAKPQKPSKPMECYKCYAAPSAPSASSYTRTNPPPKNTIYQNSISDSGGMRREEVTHDSRGKDRQIFSVSHKKVISGIVPSKAHSGHESDVTSGSYRRIHNSNSDLYATINPEFENSDKKFMLPVKMTASEKSSKNYDCLPWSHSSSQRSSEEVNAPKSETSRLLGQYEVEAPGKSEIKIIKKPEPGKGLSKPRLNEAGLVTQGSEHHSGLSKSKRVEELNSPPIGLCNYVTGTSKLRQNSVKYSKDDFVLEEPTAPPRVKRHASVTVPRNSINGPNHVSTWVSTEGKLNSVRNTNSQVEKNAWDGSLGVDLDAVAASMQQDKKEPTVLKDAVWSGKNHLSTSSNSSAKKKQHYF